MKKLTSFLDSHIETIAGVLAVVGFATVGKWACLGALWIGYNLF